jgi:hypothetical protein
VVREPRAYSILGRIVRRGADRFVVSVSAIAIDQVGPPETLVETAEVQTREQAAEVQLEMVREMAGRLELQGSRVINVATDL